MRRPRNGHGPLCSPFTSLTAILLLVLLAQPFSDHGSVAVAQRRRRTRPSPPPPSPPKPVEISIVKQFMAKLWRYAGNKEFMRLVIKGNLAGQLTNALQKTNSITLMLPNPDMCRKQLNDSSPYVRNNGSLRLIMGFHIVMGRQLPYSDLLSAPKNSKVKKMIQPTESACGLTRRSYIHCTFSYQHSSIYERSTSLRNQWQ